MYTGLKLQISGQSIQEFGQERDNREAFAQHNFNLSNKIQFSNNKVEKVKPSKNVLLRHIPNDVLFQKQNQIHEMNKVAQKYRIPFTPDEDEKLKHLANKYGTRSWSLISTYLEGRTPKQCRDRYSNYLFPGFFKGEWTNEEDCLLFKLYNEFGPKWSKIKKSFPDRSSNSIKNRWNYFLCKQEKIPEEKMISTSSSFSSSQPKEEKSLQKEKEEEKNIEVDSFLDDENGIIDIQENEFIDFNDDWLAFY